MRKLLIMSILVVVILAATSSVAMAGGWWRESTSTGPGSSGPLGNLTWETDTVSPAPYGGAEGTSWRDQVGNSGKRSPHGNFSSTSNLCKTCHAVHLAGSGSYRLLKDGTAAETRSSGEGLEATGYTPGLGNTRGNECMYCHDATSGMAQRRPFSLGELATVRGEHTIGATKIPDSNANTDTAAISGVLYNRDPGGQGAILQCYHCHSVHGGGTLQISGWINKVLRVDPAGNGGDVASGIPIDSYTTVAVKTAFCADCHNINPNWDTDPNDDTATINAGRPNPRSHPQGPAVDSKLEVYGQVAQVSTPSPQGAGFDSPGDASNGGCRGCHRARDDGQKGGYADDPGSDAGKGYWAGKTLTSGDGTTQTPDPNFAYIVGASAGTYGGPNNVWKIEGNFPHQSQESKFLGRDVGSFNGDSGGTKGVKNDADRALQKVDKVCLSCHQWNNGTEGVGKTF